MIGQANGNGDAGALATAADGAAPAANSAEETPLNRAASKPASRTQRIAAEQALEAHVERRRRLAAQIRVENPARSDEEIEERLEQFGV